MVEIPDLSKNLPNPLASVLARVTPMPMKITPLPEIESPAKSIYRRLIAYIKEFESGLDQDHEIGARLVSFGQAYTFHIESIGFFSPDIITFYGINDNKEKVQLIQNVSQLSILLIALKKTSDNPVRIGFKLEKEAERQE